MEDGGFNFDDWAKVSCNDGLDDEQGSSSSSSAEVVIDNTMAKFLIRRDSSDSVEIMSMENDYDTDVKGKDEDSVGNSGHFPSGKMCCSTCSTLMNQSLSNSMVHVKMEEIETQTDDLGRDDKEDKNTVKPPFEIEEEVEEESQLEMALDRIAEFIHHHGHQLIFIPTHLLFALLVLSAAHLTGIAHIEALDTSSTNNLVNGDVLPTIATTPKSTVTTPADNSNSQTATTTIRELQSPEWLDRLSSLLDDVSSELAAVDSQISVIERQLDLFDEQQQLGGLNNKQQLLVVDSYRQLVERQRSTARLLDKINSVLNVDRESRREPATLLDVRLKLVDLAGDFVQLNSRLTEVTFANKRRHISIVKKATSERHRQEALFLASLVDRIRNSDAAQSVPAIDDKSAACRRLFRPGQPVIVREEQNHAQDIVECLSRSRALATETWRQMNMSLEQERLATIRYRNRALFAEIAISDLREEVSFLNRTIYMQEQLQRLKEEKIRREQLAKQPSSFLQCFSQFTDFSAFSELLRRPEHCATCDLIDRLSEQFVRLLNSISSALLKGTAKEWSTKTVLEMLGSTFQVLSTSQPPLVQVMKTRPSIPVTPRVVVSSSSPPPTSWASRLKSKISSVKNTLTTAYDRLKKSVVGLRGAGRSNVTISLSPSVCQLIDANFDRIRSRVEALQHNRLYYDAAVLNSLFKDMSALQERTDSSTCPDEKVRHFLRCHLAWGHRMMRLFRWPICSDRLPQECNNQFMPWQLHLMSSLEQTSFTFEAQDNSTHSSKDPEKTTLNKPLTKKTTSLSMLPVWQFFVNQVRKPGLIKKMELNKRGDDGSPQDCAYMFLSRQTKDVAIFRQHHFAPSPPYLPKRATAAPEWCQAYPHRRSDSNFVEQGPQLPALPALLPAPECEQSSRDRQLIANNLKSDAFLNDVVKRMHA